MSRCLCFLIVILSCSSKSYASGGLRNDFLREAFTGISSGPLLSSGSAEPAPEARALWLSAEFKAQLLKKFDYRINRLRLRYWCKQGRTAWILDEVGKEQPITMGVVVEEGRIVNIEVLVYRESRGGDIKYPYFRKQFTGLTLTGRENAPKLDGHIDGITGATLSVRAMKKIATVALFLHQVALAESG